MNLYGLDYSLLDLEFSDPTLIESLSVPRQTISCGKQQGKGENLLGSSNLTAKNEKSNSKRNENLPQHRHDGTSPLPLGMDWSPPPRFWDGPNTVWPHDFCTGWSYCVTIPSWTILSESESSEPVVFYRVQVGLQSPDGVTTTRGVLRRYSDFLKLASDLKSSFHNKKLPPTPPKLLLRMKSSELLAERRCSLEDWMAKVLSDIDFSRSAPSACFLELEAAARSSFYQVSDINLRCNSGTSSDPFLSILDASVVAGTSALASNFGDDSTFETPEIVSPSLTETTVNEAFWENGYNKLAEFNEENPEKYMHEVFHARVSNGVDREKIYTGASPSATSNLREVHRQSSTSSKCSASIEPTESADMLSSSDLQFSHSTLVVLPTDEQQKMNRLLTTMQQRVVTSKTDMEDLIERLNQELAVRQYLTVKVKDLEIELESTKKSGKENLEQAILIERERFTQMQWDMEEIRRKCMEMELRLKAEQDEKAFAEETKASIIQENEALRQELDSTREQLKNLKKSQEDSDLRSKSDVKLLVKEVKSLRSSQSELRQELDRLTKERTEFERRLQKERQRRECSNVVDVNLLHEFEILRSRLEECSVNFLIEEENKLKMDTSSLSDAVDILATSENRIGLLLAEAQLLAQEVESPATITSLESGDVMTTDNELRKMLTSVFIDNAKLRKQVNSIIRCTLSTTEASPDSYEAKEVNVPSRKTVLSKFLER